MTTRRKPSRRSKARQTSETAGRTQSVRPIAAPSGANREAATALPAAGAPAGWTDARTPRKGPKTPRRDRRAPRWSIAASPATDASPGYAPRCRRKKTASRSSDLRPASPPREPTAPTTGNHLKRTNTSDFLADSFSSLLAWDPSISGSMFLRFRRSGWRGGSLRLLQASALRPPRLRCNAVFGEVRSHRFDDEIHERLRRVQVEFALRIAADFGFHSVRFRPLRQILQLLSRGFTQERNLRAKFICVAMHALAAA